MSRQNRIAFLVAAVLVVAVSGTVLATRRAPPVGQPAAPAASAQGEADEGPPDAADVAHAAERLRAHGYEGNEAQLTDLASRYGVGGAVRLVVWADESGESVDAIAARRDDGMGWGQIAHDLGVSPGIGAVMRGGGNEDEATGD
ncbi:MAG TPA: hypothetical protein VFW95_01050 [Candidatus Limnocylindria bacterium]|nr:hypothetical protein [Candidatus Limnocylindria bacterium]